MSWITYVLLGVMVVFRAAGRADDQDDKRPPVSIPEPTKKSAASGHFVIASIQYRQAREGVDTFAAALVELVSYFNENTDISTPVRWMESSLSAPNLSEAGLLYLSGNDARLQFDTVEKKALGDYLKNGGMLFAEDVMPLFRNRRGRGGGAGIEGSAFDLQFKALMADPAVMGGRESGGLKFLGSMR